MHIIPVIDLMQGHAVLAQGGKRAEYRPLCTPLSASSEPFAVVDALLALYSFTTIYVADLDAIMQQGNHNGLLLALYAHYPGITFWVDEGINSLQRMHQKKRPERWLPVIGSESLTDENWPLLGKYQSDFVLSLDFQDHEVLGPTALFNSPAIWPERIIVMNLACVGSQRGPDWKRLLIYRREYPDKRWYAGGGVRHEEDLKCLDAAGIEGALVASALHRRVLDRMLMLSQQS